MKKRKNGMGRKKKNRVGNVISVRVTDHELENFREIMKITRKSASTVMREAIKLFLATAS